MVRNRSRRVNVSPHRYARMMQTRHGMPQRTCEDQRSVSRFRQGRRFNNQTVTVMVSCAMGAF